MNDLTYKHINELQLSDTIKKIFTDNGYSMLIDLLEKSPEELMTISGITLSHISEYKKFIIENRLQYLQKDF